MNCIISVKKTELLISTLDHMRSKTKKGWDTKLKKEHQHPVRLKWPFERLQDGLAEKKTEKEEKMKQMKRSFEASVDGKKVLKRKEERGWRNMRQKKELMKPKRDGRREREWWGRTEKAAMCVCWLGCKCVCVCVGALTWEWMCVCVCDQVWVHKRERYYDWISLSTLRIASMNQTNSIKDGKNHWRKRWTSNLPSVSVSKST